MSFFNKVFASIGIGAAKVDTKIENDTVTAGEVVRGMVEIQGGNVEQKIDEIYLSLHTNYIKESDDNKYTVTATIDRFRITEAFTISANQTKAIPFSFPLPFDTPITAGNTKVWVQTGLDIKNAVNPTDKDYLRVLPNRLTDSILSAITELGFRLRQVECEEASHRLRKRLPFIQEFEFIPVSGAFRGKLDELELVMFPVSNDQIECLVEVDRKARGLGGFLAEALNMDETTVKFTISTNDLPNLKTILTNVISRYA